MTTIDVETLRTWLEEGRPVTVLDVRPAAERAEWAIPGSLHVNAYDTLKARDPAALADVDVPSDGPVVTVCAAGKTSLIAAEQLAAQGVEAMSLEGGMKAWSLAWNTAEVPILGSSVQMIQVRRTGKGCLSYLIGAGEEAFVIDASLDPQVYLALAAQHGWQIMSVFDTHIHADHLSRSRQLAERSGAMLFLPDQQRVSFPFTAMRDGDTLATPQLMLTALRTPGHASQPVPFDGVPIGARLAEIDEQVDLLHARRTVFVETLVQRLPPTPHNYERITRLNEVGLFPEGDVTELEAGANRCAIS